MRKGRRKRGAKPISPAFYEAGMPPATGETGPSGGGGSEGGGDALREPQDERDELRRWFRELLCRQPDDTGLVLRASRAIVKPKESRAEDTRRQMEAVLEGLGDQLLPRDG